MATSSPRPARSAILLIALALACGGWRSALYPEAWTPAHTGDAGRFLHDFSYAGYRRGEHPIPDVRGPIFKVAKPSTKAIQAALDRGGVVQLPAGTFVIDGTLTIRKPGTVLRGAGAERTRLRFTQTAGLNGRASLMAVGKVRRGPDLRLAKAAANRATFVELEAISSLAVGDRVAAGLVIDDAFRKTHGMLDYWRFAAGKWRALFRREVTAIDGKRVTLDIPLRYPLPAGASLRKETGYLTGVGIEDLAVCNAIDYDTAWKATRVHAIELRDCRDCWVRRIRSFDGGAKRHLQSGGIRVRTSARVTIADCHLAWPQHRGGGGNGYLFEVMQSGEVLTVDCTARHGRHNFIQNWDLGTSGCVWLRCDSADGFAVFVQRGELGITGLSEFHHSLAMACLVDSCVLDDGWKAANRRRESSGAGHTATQCVFWNVRGKGWLRCHQFGHGYIIGTSPELNVVTKLGVRGATGTGPADYAEGLGHGARLEPASLYEDQLRRRLKRNG